jgi:hypothetical protein
LVAGVGSSDVCDVYCDNDYDDCDYNKSLNMAR